MQAIEQFFARFAELVPQLAGQQRLSAFLQAEDTAFVRWNKGCIRQPGTVAQATCTLELSAGKRHATLEVTLACEPEQDRRRLQAALAQLRDVLSDLPEDPHFLVPDLVQSSEDLPPLPADPVERALDDIATAAVDLDLVGILAQGPVMAAYADSAGQRNAWRRPVSIFDYSIYAHGDKAVKQQLAGAQWDGAQFDRQLAATRKQLPLLALPPVEPKPGHYRAWLTPAALGEILELLSWFSLSEKATRTQQSALLRLARGEESLHPSVMLAEDTADGVGPDFTASGFRKTPKVQLIASGRHAASLVNPRTAREYGLSTDGAGTEETPDSLSLSPGDIDEASVLARIGTGVWVSNLWYLNFSDRVACRMTGMTRFASFWVEDGQLKAPLSVMRFDDTLYRMLGTALEGLGSQAELRVDAGTWRRRSNRSLRLPGALLSSLALTL